MQQIQWRSGETTKRQVRRRTIRHHEAGQPRRAEESGEDAGEEGQAGRATEGRCEMMHLRQPLVVPPGRPLRVLIHARFSTEEQRQSSIDDQITACQRFVEANLPKGTKPKDVAIELIKEPEVSGEIADRPGINQVWAGIEAKRWDVIVAEESSRLYRHHTKAGELFESAVDAGVRVICPSDYIDTLDDDWPDRLHMCQMQHARSNF